MKIKFSSKTISTAIIFLLSIVVGLLTVHFVGEGKKEEAISFEEIAQSNEENPEWADISEIEEKNWSLTPGAYVGVAEAEDDGIDFAERMHEIHAELLTLQQQSNELMEKISANFKELGI